MNKKRNQVFDLVLFSIFMALILLMSLVPNIGFIRVGVVSVTLVHVPVLIGILVLPIWYALGLGFTFGLGSLIAAFIYGQSPGDLAFQNPLISILPRVLFALIAFFVFFGLRKLQKVKHGDSIIFALISVITIVFFYFGAQALAAAIDGDNPSNLVNILTPIFLVISGLMIGVYYFFINNKRLKESIAIPSSIMISTLMHTVLVLTALSIFTVSAFGDSKLVDVIKAVLGVNGFIEIIIAVVLVTPVATAILSAFPERTNDGRQQLIKEGESRNDLTVWCWKY